MEEKVNLHVNCDFRPHVITPHDGVKRTIRNAEIHPDADGNGNTIGGGKDIKPGNDSRNVLLMGHNTKKPTDEGHVPNLRNPRV